MLTHLVLSGGGPNFICHLGILKEVLACRSVDLQACFATSSGTLVAILMGMRVPIDDMIAYFLDRPWDKWMRVKRTGLEMSFCDSHMLHEVAAPFMNAMNVSLDITFQEFYERFGVDLHFFACEVQAFRTVDFCRATYPDARILEAGIMSSSLPPMFEAHLFQDKYFIDGGVSTNFPLLACLEHASHENVLALCHVFPEGDFKPTALGIMAHVFNKVFAHMNSSEQVEAEALKCTYITTNTYSMADPELWRRFFESRETRTELLENGRAAAVAYFTGAERC